MHVLVTGANGFVGRHLCNSVREQGDRVSEVNGPGAASSLDVTDPAAVRGALEAARPDAVVHLAGFSSVGKSHADPVRAFAVNTMGTVHLLAAARDVAPKSRLLLISSAETYGNVAEDALATEEHPLRPSSPYAASKAAAELAGFQFHRSSGLEVVSARAFNHIGAGQDPTFVVPSFARQIEAIRAGRAAPALQVGDVSVVRDFSHVADVVEAYRLLLLKGVPGEAYNVCSGEGRTIRSLLEEMLRLAAVRAEVRVDPQRLRSVDIPRLVGDPSKLRALGWRATRSVSDALREALEEARGA